MFRVLALVLFLSLPPILVRAEEKDKPDKCDQLPEIRSEAERGDGTAELKLFHMYFEGYCTPKNLDEAPKWLARSVASGNSQAQVVYGALLEKTGQYNQAADVAKKSAEQGNADGQALLADLYFHGKGVKKDDKQTATLATMAAKKNVALAEILLCRLYADGRGELPRDRIEADKWLIIALKNFRDDPDIKSLQPLLEHSMTHEEIEKAKQRAAKWKPE